MTYNGLFGDTTSGTCANATTKAQTRYNNAQVDIEYNVNSTTKAGKTYTGLNNAIHAVGFTYSGVASSTSMTMPTIDLAQLAMTLLLTSILP